MKVRINVINYLEFSSAATATEKFKTEFDLDIHDLKNFFELVVKAASKQANLRHFEYELSPLETEGDAYSIQFIENLFNVENGDEYKYENEHDYDIVISDSSTEIFGDVKELINNVFNQASTANLPKLTKHVGFDVDGDISVIAYKIKK